MVSVVDLAALRSSRAHDIHSTAEALHIQQEGGRLYWPSREYNFDDVYAKLFGSATSPGSRVLRTHLRPGSTPTTIDTQGAGPYGPEGELYILISIITRADQFELPMDRIDTLIGHIIPACAAELLAMDTGLDIDSARIHIKAGAAYGRITFPLTSQAFTRLSSCFFAPVKDTLPLARATLHRLADAAQLAGSIRDRNAAQNEVIYLRQQLQNIGFSQVDYQNGLKVIAFLRARVDNLSVEVGKLRVERDGARLGCAMAEDLMEQAQRALHKLQRQMDSDTDSLENDSNDEQEDDDMRRLDHDNGGQLPVDDVDEAVQPMPDDDVDDEAIQPMLVDDVDDEAVQLLLSEPAPADLPAVEPASVRTSAPLLDLSPFTPPVPGPALPPSEALAAQPIKPTQPTAPIPTEPSTSPVPPATASQPIPSRLPLSLAASIRPTAPIPAEPPTIEPPTICVPSAVCSQPARSTLLMSSSTSMAAEPSTIPVPPAEPSQAAASRQETSHHLRDPPSAVTDTVPSAVTLQSVPTATSSSSATIAEPAPNSATAGTAVTHTARAILTDAPHAATSSAPGTSPAPTSLISATTAEVSFRHTDRRPQGAGRPHGRVVPVGGQHRVYLAVFGWKRLLIPEEEIYGWMRGAGRYIDYKRIGAGAQGTVYKARDHLSPVAAAIKVARTSPGTAFPSSVWKEVGALSRIRHANVVNLRDVLVLQLNDRPELHLVMDYCRTDLQQVLNEEGQRRRLTPRVVCGIAKQLASGLRAVHQVSVKQLDSR
ncbi:unnamed protein product [Tilletia controversa]|nr:unnamed protein product [Tilletia controversa]